MKNYQYAIVGGGMTAAHAVKGIRRYDREGSIGLFSMDRYPPYDRPYLSKKLWTGDKTLEQVWSYSAQTALGVHEHLGTEIVALDPDRRTLEDQDGNLYGYDKLLLATGGTPVKLTSTSSRTVYFRTLDDYLTVWRAASKSQSFVVVGGGFIGAEMAAALNMKGCAVRMVFPESGILARVLPRELSDHVTALYRERGVDVVTDESVSSIEDNAAGVVVRTTSGQELQGQLVILGLGIRPNTKLASDAGLLVDNGIVVNQRGETSRANIWAAGDVANIPAPALNRTIRVEHEDNAVTAGRVVGINMAGGEASQDDLPFFYSDLFDLGFEAVGLLRSDLQVVADWVEPFKEGVVYYLDDDRKVVGVLNWNVWDGVPTAREMIKAGESVTDESVLGRIRNH